MFQEIDVYLQDFSDSLLDEDYIGATRWIDIPQTILRASGTEMFATREALVEELRTFWSAYRDSGIRASTFKTTNLRSYAPLFVMVDVQWRLFDAKGAERFTLYSTYVLRQTEDGLRICGVISHNERNERPELASEPSV